MSSTFREAFTAAHMDCRVAGVGLAAIDEAAQVMRPDRAIDKPTRDCAQCAKKFQPTLKRRSLCGRCYATATSSLEN